VTRLLTLALASLLATQALSAQAPQAGSAAAATTSSGAAPAENTQKPADPQQHADAQKPADSKPDAAVPQGFNYDPQGRRDPFISMLRRGNDNSGPRLSGLAGLATAEVSLRGVVRSEGSFVGILQGVDSRNYIVRAGDKLSDGTIQRITADTMVILQQINDPLSLEKQREVRKLLRQVEEAK
jgi:Tfp pilus assembly protein PilP